MPHANKRKNIFLISERVQQAVLLFIGIYLLFIFTWLREIEKAPHLVKQTAVRAFIMNIDRLFLRQHEQFFIWSALGICLFLFVFFLYRVIKKIIK